VMASPMELDRLLERIINELVHVMDAEGGTLYLVDEGAGELFSRVLLENTEQLREIRVKIGEGIAGDVARRGEIMNIKDVSKHPSFNQTFDRMTGYETRN